MEDNNDNNFYEIQSGSMDLNYEELTVGFNKIPNSQKWALGNKKGEIYVMDYSASNLKFNEKFIYLFIFCSKHFFYFRELLTKLSYENINKMKLDPFEPRNFMVLSKDTNPQVF